MDWSECPVVEVIPGKVSGVPLVRHSRVQADAVLENYESGESVDDIAYNFELDREDIIAVLSYASERMAAKSAG
jgi:uncharacterized protein (DUF433 family)